MESFHGLITWRVFSFQPGLSFSQVKRAELIASRLHEQFESGLSFSQSYTYPL